MKVVAQAATERCSCHMGQDSRGEDLGVVVDVEEETVYPPFNIHFVIARGYWEEPRLGATERQGPWSQKAKRGSHL
jgi:hypothetical protein